MTLMVAWRLGAEVLAVSPGLVETLLGNPTKAREKLGWQPEMTAREMWAEMVAEDLKTAQRHALLKMHGLDLPVSLENG